MFAVSSSVSHLPQQPSLRATNIIKCRTLWMRFYRETSVLGLLASEDGVETILPRSCTLATPLDNSHRPPHTITTMLLDLLRWRFQKDEFVLPSMRVRRRHIEREHAVVLSHRLLLLCRWLLRTRVLDHVSRIFLVLFVHPTCIERLSACSHGRFSTPPFHDTSHSLAT